MYALTHNMVLQGTWLCCVMQLSFNHSASRGKSDMDKCENPRRPKLCQISSLLTVTVMPRSCFL